MPITNSRVIPLTCSGHTRPVVDLQFSSMDSDNNYLLISACKDGNPMLRDGRTGDWIGTFLGHKGAVWSARLNKKSDRAVTASADFSARVWDTFSGEELYKFEHQHIVRACDFSSDSSRVLTGGLEKKLRIFDLYRPESAPLEATGHEGTIKSVAWDDSRQTMLSAGDDDCIRVWDIRTMQQVQKLDQGTSVTSMVTSADGNYLTSTAGTGAYFWDTRAGYTLANQHTLEHSASTISLHPDQTKFVAGSGTDLWVRIYDFKTGEELEVYKGHHGPIWTVSYSPDGELYATGSEDGTIRLWKTNPTKPYGLWQNC
ncbi:hypothetical protein INT43_006092 [Umbelopsis isabellina]|uniref:Serine-threonine kinase receptor-associated protein n=1 Tax=Mortierella isabellina TaxID=91625 RepID=A0A8H7PJT7_MORIS|nr:hypothetical protein INT43_006092 [Umbelopsis isabellina]